MGQVVVTVNGRAFPLNCADGEEPRIRRLAQYVDAKIGEFVKTLGQVGEARLILLAALAIADELSDANDALERGSSGEANDQTTDAAAEAASGIDNLTQRIESIAARIKTP